MTLVRPPFLSKSRTLLKVNERAPNLNRVQRRIHLVSLWEIMFASSLDHMSEGHAWHCLLQDAKHCLVNFSVKVSSKYDFCHGNEFAAKFPSIINNNVKVDRFYPIFLSWIGACTGRKVSDANQNCWNLIPGQRIDLNSSLLWKNTFKTTEVTSESKWQNLEFSPIDRTEVGTMFI